jgi:hypothetical protein
MKPLALSVVANLLLMVLAFIAYDQFVRLRELHVAVVDVATVYRQKEAQFTALLTTPSVPDRNPTEDREARQLAADFARALPMALDEITAECHCLLLVRAATVGRPAGVADLTETLKQKLRLP